MLSVLSLSPYQLLFVAETMLGYFSLSSNNFLFVIFFMWYICLYPHNPHPLHFSLPLFFVSSLTNGQLPLFPFPPHFLVLTLTSPLEWLYDLCGAITGSSTLTSLGTPHSLLSHCELTPNEALEGSCTHLNPYRHSFPSHQHSKNEEIQFVQVLWSKLQSRAYSSGCGAVGKQKSVWNRLNGGGNFCVRWYRREDDIYLQIP